MEGDSSNNAGDGNNADEIGPGRRLLVVAIQALRASLVAAAIVAVLGILLALVFHASFVGGTAYAAAAVAAGALFVAAGTSGGNRGAPRPTGWIGGSQGWFPQTSPYPEDPGSKPWHRTWGSVTPADIGGGLTMPMLAILIFIEMMVYLWSPWPTG